MPPDDRCRHISHPGITSTSYRGGFRLRGGLSASWYPGCSPEPGSTPEMVQQGRAGLRSTQPSPARAGPHRQTLATTDECGTLLAGAVRVPHSQVGACYVRGDWGSRGGWGRSVGGRAPMVAATCWEEPLG